MLVKLTKQLGQDVYNLIAVQPRHNRLGQLVDDVRVAGEKLVECSFRELDQPAWLSSCDRCIACSAGQNRHFADGRAGANFGEHKTIIVCVAIKVFLDRGNFDQALDNKVERIDRVPFVKENLSGIEGNP